MDSHHSCTLCCWKPVRFLIMSSWHWWLVAVKLQKWIIKDSHESGSYSFCTRSVLKSCNSIVCYEESYILFKYPPCWPIWMCKPTWMIFENCSSHKDIIWLQMTNITLYGLHFMHLKAPSHRSFSLYRRKQCECCAKQLKVWNNVRRIKWWQNDWTILLFY